MKLERPAVKKLIRDPQLDELVRTLNETDAREESRPVETVDTLPQGNDLEQLLIEVAQRGASDLLLVAG